MKFLVELVRSGNFELQKDMAHARRTLGKITTGHLITVCVHLANLLADPFSQMTPTISNCVVQPPSSSILGPLVIPLTSPHHHHHLRYPT
jgi:hypothetical protein